MRRHLNKSGASMLFVLAAMLLLSAIGVSALNAAFAGRGTALVKRGENQLALYASSMERTVDAALRNGLDALIIEQAYRQLKPVADGALAPGEYDTFTVGPIRLELALDAGTIAALTALGLEATYPRITVVVNSLDAVFTAFRAYEAEIGVIDSVFGYIVLVPEVPHEPLSVWFSGGSMDIIIETAFARAESGRVNVRIAYAYNGAGRVEENCAGIESKCTVEPEWEDMVVTNGTWEFISHEKLDQ